MNNFSKLLIVTAVIGTTACNKTAADLSSLSKEELQTTTAECKALPEGFMGDIQKKLKSCQAYTSALNTLVEAEKAKRIATYKAAAAEAIKKVKADATAQAEALKAQTTQFNNLSKEDFDQALANIINAANNKDTEKLAQLAVQPNLLAAIDQLITQGGGIADYKASDIYNPQAESDSNQTTWAEPTLAVAITTKENKELDIPASSLDSLDKLKDTDMPDKVEFSVNSPVKAITYWIQAEKALSDETQAKPKKGAKKSNAGGAYVKVTAQISAQGNLVYQANLVKVEPSKTTDTTTDGNLTIKVK